MIRPRSVPTIMTMGVTTSPQVKIVGMAKILAEVGHSLRSMAVLLTCSRSDKRVGSLWFCTSCKMCRDHRIGRYTISRSFVVSETANAI